MDECDNKFITAYSAKGLVSTYYNIKYKRQDLTTLLDEHLTEQDIDDYINLKLNKKLY